MLPKCTLTPHNQTHPHASTILLQLLLPPPFFFFLLILPLLTFLGTEKKEKVVKW